MRIQQGREAVLRLRVEDEGGVLVQAAATPVLVVTTSGGTNLPPGPVSTLATGVYGATLPAVADLDVLTVQWSFAPSGGVDKSKLIVTGGRTVPLWRYREDPELAALSASSLIRLSDTVDEWLRDALGFPTTNEPFVASFRSRKQSVGLIVPDVKYPKTLTAVTIDNTPFTPAEIADLRVVQNTVERGSTADPFLTGVASRYPWPAAQYQVTGTHGPPTEWNGYVPEDLERAAIILARYTSRGSNYPERARAVQTDGAMITFATPSPDRPTGLPEVDNVITRIRLATPV